MLGKRLAAHQSLHSMTDIDSLLPQFYSPLSDNALQVSNASRSVAIVGEPYQQSFGVHVDESFWRAGADVAPVGSDNSLRVVGHHWCREDDVSKLDVQTWLSIVCMCVGRL